MQAKGMSVGYYMIWACMCVCIRMQIWKNKLPNIWDMSVCVCMILYAAIHTHTHTHSVHRNFHNMKQLITYLCDNISVVRHKWFHRHEIISNQGPFLKSVLEAYFIWVNRKKVVDAWCFCNGDRYVQETWKLIWAPKADIFDYTAAFCSFF